MPTCIKGGHAKEIRKSMKRGETNFLQKYTYTYFAFIPPLCECNLSIFSFLSERGIAIIKATKEMYDNASPFEPELVGVVQGESILGPRSADKDRGRHWN